MSNFFLRHMCHQVSETSPRPPITHKGGNTGGVKRRANERTVVKKRKTVGNQQRACAKDSAKDSAATRTANPPENAAKGRADGQSK